MEMALDAAAPASYKRKIQSSADSRTSQGNQAPSPLFRRFGANHGGETFCDARGEFLEKLFLGQILSVLLSGGSHGRLTHYYQLLAYVRLKTVLTNNNIGVPLSD